VAPASGRFADLGQRTLSALVLGGVALGVIWLGGTAMALLVGALAAAMAWEWRTMTRAPATPALADAAPAVVALAGAVAVAHGAGFAAGLAWLVVALALAALIDVVRRRGAAGAWLMAGGVYIGLGCLAFLSLRAFEPFGFLTILWVILTVMAADVGGYFGGRLIGGAKLWPAVSPKKTWAGLLGGVGLAFLLGGLFSWATTGTYFEEVCTVSAIAALLAQGGDLAESAAKRHFGVKDAGTLIPGHGGALDRFDGLLAASLVAAAVTHWRGQTVFIW
jgi:phosphatidate cytidylyltransferase